MTLEGSAAKFMVEVDELIRARYPLIYVETFEEVRALTLLKRVATRGGHAAKGFYIWSRTQGLVRVNGKPQPVPDTQPLGAALEWIDRAPKGIVVLCDAAESFPDEPLAVRQLRELAWSVNGKDVRDETSTAKPVTVFLIGGAKPDVEALSKELKIVQLPLPERSELREMVVGAMDEFGEYGTVSVGDKAVFVDRLAQALLGLTEQEADNALAKAVIHSGGYVPEVVKAVLDEKASIISQIEGLTYEEPEAPNALGGYSTVRQFIDDAGLTSTPEAEAFGVEPSRGMLLVGLPGCGKDHTAKVAAGRQERPLMKCSFSAMMSSGDGRLGAAEGAWKRGIAVADKVKPILHFSEFEKAFEGMASSAKVDAGTTSRMGGELLDWMSSQRGTFVIATANSIEGLPPELVAIGRWSEVFFYDLPRTMERSEILAIHLARRQRDPEKFNLLRVANATEGFSGRELEQVIKNALLVAFKEGKRPLTTEDLVACAAVINPLSKQDSGKIETLRRWAKDHGCREANSPEPQPAEGRRGRMLEME